MKVGGGRGRGRVRGAQVFNPGPIHPSGIKIIK